MKRKYLTNKLLPLLLAALLALPSGAKADALRTAEGWTGTAPSAREEGLARMELMDTEVSEFYHITVDGTTFSSGEDTAGIGWTYDGETTTLTLDNYNGGPISAGGELTIDTTGSCTVAGEDGDFGTAAICTEEILYINVEKDSELAVSGGDGQLQGAGAIEAGGLFLYCEGAAEISGGETFSPPTEGDYLFGGDGILASVIYLEGLGITVRGGDGNGESGDGGCALIGHSVYVMADCTLIGGGGWGAGPAVFFTDECIFGLVDAVIRCGDAQVLYYAVQSGEGLSWSYALHTEIEGTVTDFTITVNRYTLELLGEGGFSPGGEESLSLIGRYSTEYLLGDYLFFQEGRTQVCWELDGNDLGLDLPLCPEEDITLSAKWLDTKDGDAVLISTDGTSLANGRMYRRYHSSSIVLPELTGLVAWCDTIRPAPDEDGICTGTWYAAGDTAHPDDIGVTTLYSVPLGDGQYVLCHAAEGSLDQGGTLLVPESSGEGTQLSVKLPEAHRILPPEDHSLAGWYDPERDTSYTPGQEITLTRGTVLHLYPQWEQTVFTAEQDGILFRADLRDGTLKITVPGELVGQTGAAVGMSALYDGAGKMTTCGVASFEADGTMTVTMPLGDDMTEKGLLFFLGADYAPQSAAVPFSLDEIVGGEE